jgi:hypothetical protein
MKTPTWLFRWLGLGIGILSLVKLVDLGFHVGWIVPLRALIDYFEALLHVIFGWAEPYLKIALDFVNTKFGWSLHLYPHWKYVFTLLWLYFGADTKLTSSFGGSWQAGLRGGYGYEKGAIAAAAWGLFVALLASVAVGVEPFDGPIHGIYLVLATSAGFVLYELGDRIWRQRITGSRKYLLFTRLAPLLLTAVIVAAEAFIAELPIARLLPNSGLIFLFAFISGLTLYYLCEGAWLATQITLDPQEPWRARLRFSTAFRIGSLMFQAIFGAALFAAANAGLKFVGL